MKEFQKHYLFFVPSGSTTSLKEGQMRYQTWKTRKTDPEKEAFLSNKTSLSPVITRLLVNRGHDDIEKINLFLNPSLKNLPSPLLMKDLKKAVDRLVTAIFKKEKILVYGDYDVDGTTGTSLLLLFFQEIGYPIDYYIPHRMHEGYSLNKKAIDTIKARGVSLVITVDNGISSAHEVEHANTLGIDVIITDHHQIPPNLPKAFAILNPHQTDCDFPDKNICGTAVAYYLALGLRQKLREENFFKNIPEPNLKKYLDLVALATVADVMPLKGLNRIFVKLGLDVMEKTNFVGLEALKKVSDINGKVDASHLGFRLGPRINAGGRLYDASAGVKLLTSTDPALALKWAQELDSANRERQGVEENILHQALNQMTQADLHQKSHVLYHPEWHAGVIGIVASKLVERFSRPFILLAPDSSPSPQPSPIKGEGANALTHDRTNALLKGSGRSFASLNIVEALEECSSHLKKFGGHKAACGLSLDEKNLNDFKMAFEKAVSQRLSTDECQPVLKFDEEITFENLSMDLARDIQKMAPFGMGNPEPVFVVNQSSVLSPRVVGTKHLKFQAEENGKRIDSIAFGFGSELGQLSLKMSLAFNLDINNFNGASTLQLKIKDMKGKI